jgi:hypothetical protein
VGGLVEGVGRVDRRRLLRWALLAPPAAAALAGCTGRGERDDGPDPLIALADAARADAALVTAAVTADAGLSARLAPLRDARTAHAAALDAEVARLAGRPAAPAAAPSAAPTAAPSAGTTPVTAARVRDALTVSRRAAEALVPGLPVERVGLVASVAACCATYAGLLA